MGPLPQGSEQEILKRARLRARAQAPPPSAPAEVPKKVEPPWTVKGYAENTLDAAWQMAKDLYEIIPSTVKSYQKNVPYLLKNSKYVTGEMVGKAAKEAGGGIVDAITEKYKKHGGLAGALYHDTPGVVSDVLTIVALGGGAIKNAGKVARAAGGGQKASQLIEAGKWLEELPGRAVRGGIDATVKGVTGGSVDLSKRRKFLAIKGEEQGRKILKAERYTNDVIKKIDSLVSILDSKGISRHAVSDPAPDSITHR